MNVPRTITVVAAATAIGVGFAPYLDSFGGAPSLSEFSADQPAAFWFGRAAVVLLVITASAAFRSLRLAVGCAVLAVAAAVAPMVVPALRGEVELGWATYVGSPTPPHLPTVYATPRWGLAALIAVAVFTATVLVLALVRVTARPSPMRTTVVALVAVAAAGALTALAVSYRNSSMGTTISLGTPRRYVDYLPVSSGSNLSGSSAWYAIASVVLALVAVVATQRPVSATPPSRST